MATTSRANRRASKANAAVAKAAGSGSTATMTKETTSRGILGTLGRIGGGIVGGITGGPAGIAAGAELGGRIGSSLEGGGGGGRGTPSRSFAPGFQSPSDPCGRGRINIGGKCIDPTAIFPGGRPGVTPAPGTVVQRGGAAVMGAFGLPAKEPEIEERIHRSCGPGMVLGKDNLCYPRAVLSRRSKFRKWRQPPRPPVTSGDVKAIRRATRARERVKELAKDVGFKTPKRR